MSSFVARRMVDGIGKLGGYCLSYRQAHGSEALTTGATAGCGAVPLSKVYQRRTASMAMIAERPSMMLASTQASFISKRSVAFVSGLFHHIRMLCTQAAKTVTMAKANGIAVHSA